MSTCRLSALILISSAAIAAPVTRVRVRRLPAILLAFAAVAAGRSAPAARLDAGPAARVTTSVSADTVTAGQRFEVVYSIEHADSLRLLAPVAVDPGTCRVVSAAWEAGKGAGTTGRITFIAVSIDSVVVPAQAFDFTSPAGDTLRAWSEPVRLGLRYLAAQSQDLRPLKEQWSIGPNWLLWSAVAAAALALAAAVVIWLRRRARRPAAVAPEVRLPPDFVALAELERIEAMGLVARGEFKTYYTLVIDALRRYLEARFRVEAMDRTTHELLGDLACRDLRVDGLAPLLEEADLVKFAKVTPPAPAAHAAIESARAIVIATTPRAAPAAPREATA